MSEASVVESEARSFKRYPAYKDSGIEWLGYIPAHWSVNRTKFVARLRSGHTPSRQHPEYWENCTIPWFGLADVWQIREGAVEYVSETNEKISELGLANSAARLLPRGTVILSRTASVGFAAILNVDMATTQDFVNWVCGPSIRPEYLLYVFRSMQHEFRRLTMGSTHQTIYMPDVGQFSTPIPPIREQERIVELIRSETGRIDALVAKKERLIQLLEEKRTALITRAVTKGIDPTAPMKDSGVEWLGEIPVHWGTSFLDKLIDPLRRITYGIVQPGDPDPDGIPMVRGQNYSRGWSPLEEIFRVAPAIEAPYLRARLRPGDIVMTIVGAGTGNVAIVPDWLAGANVTQTTARIALDSRKGNNRYFAYQLASVVGNVSVELTVKGAAQPGLNLGHLAKYRMVVPPATEQECIANYLDRETAAFEALVTKSRDAVQRLKEFRAALISAAVTGKIDVREDVA